MTRTITVDPVRLDRWLAGFTDRHGPAHFTIERDTAQVAAADGAEARIRVPFPPLRGAQPADLVAHVLRERTVGALLVRRGGVAVGVFEGRRLVTSKIETGYVQGRTKAGGWSQQRYARRRANQARRMTEAAADLLVGLVLPRIEELDAVVTGGDRPSVEAVLADPRVARLAELAGLGGPTPARVYPLPDPRLDVLRRFPDQFLGVELTLNDLA